MSEEVKKKEAFEDYETKPVPEEARYRWFSQGMIWAGSAFCLAAFSVGGMLASTMNFGSFLIAVLVGAAILTVIAAMFGIVGAHTHLASAFSSRFAFGLNGAKIFGLIGALSLFGWFGFQCSYFASSAISTLRMFNIANFDGSILSNPTLWCIVGGLAMMLTAVVGVKGIKWLSNIGVPLLFVLVFVAAIITLTKVSMADLSAASAAAAGGMSIAAGITTVVGSFIAGACSVPDITRFSKKNSDAVAGSIIGYMISFPIILLLGGFFFYAFQTSDLCDIFINYCGLGGFAAFVLIVSTWTTNDNNLYSSVLGITNAVGDYIKIPRWLLTVIVGIISTLLGALGIINYFTSFLNFLGVLVPPFAAVVIADFYLYNKAKYEFAQVGSVSGMRWDTFGSALVGSAVGLLCTYANIGFLKAIIAVVPASLFAMIMAVACYVVIHTVTAKKAA